MLRKLLYLMTLVTIVWTVTGLIDRQQATRRRELWAEATD